MVVRLLCDPAGAALLVHNEEGAVGVFRACVVDCGGIEGQAEGCRVKVVGVRRDAPEFAVDEVDHEVWGLGCCGVAVNVVGMGGGHDRGNEVVRWGMR